MTKYDILKYYEIALRDVENIIGVNSTSNFRIDKICIRIIPNYLGTFSSNNIPRMKNNTCCIVNTDSNNKPGTHWTCLFKYKDKIYFYDSFARDYKILSPYWKHKKWINTNTNDADQSLYEKDCASRSIAWLLTFEKYKTKSINII